MRHATKADAANAELTHIAARTTAQLAAIFVARGQRLGRILALGFSNFACFSHYVWVGIGY